MASLHLRTEIEESAIGAQQSRHGNRSVAMEAESVEADIDVAAEANGRPDEFAFVAPGPTADNAVVRIPLTQADASVGAPL